MDELGPLGIEFLINNPEIIAQAKQAEATLQGVNESMQASATQASAAINSIFKAQSQSIKLTADSTVEGLKIQLAQLKALAALTPTSQTDKISAFNAQIQQTEVQIARLSNVGKQGFDQFGDAIVNNSSKIDAAIGRVTSLQSVGARVITQFSRQIISLGVGVLSGIIGAKAIESLIEYIANLDIFKAKVTEAALQQQTLNNALAGTEYTNAIKNVNQLTIDIELAKEGFLDKTKVLSEYNKELGASIGYADNLDQAEQLLVKNGNAFIQVTLLKAAAQLALQDAAKKAYEAAQDQNKDFGSIGNRLPAFGVGQSSAPGYVPGVDPVANFKAQQDAVKKAQQKAIDDANSQKDKLLKIAQDFQRQAAQIAQTSGIDFFDGTQDAKVKSNKTEQDALNALLQTEITLREKIKEFTDKSQAKELSPDQTALTNISDQFNAINFQITQANAKYDAFVKKFGQGEIDTFNANPANKTKLVKTDPATLTAAENSAIDNQANLNENTYIQQDIDKKKKLYADYEAYRLKVGDVIADSDYADLLKSGKDFQTYLLNIQSSIDNTDLSGANQQRKTLIQKQIDENIEAQAVALQKLKEQYASYQQQREALIQSAQTKEAALTKAGDTQAAQQAQKDLADQLDLLDEANFKKLDAYKALFSNITTLSVSQAKQSVGNLITYYSAQFALGAISLQAYEQIVSELTQKLQELNNIKFQDIGAVGNEISSIASDISGLLPSLSAGLSLVGKLTTGYASLGKSINDATTATKGSAAQFTDYASAAGSAVGIVISAATALYNAGQKANAAEAAREMQLYALQAKAIQAVNDEIQRQIDLTGTLYGTQKITDYAAALKTIQANEATSTQALQSKLYLTGNADLDKLIAQFNTGNDKDKFGVAEVEAYIAAAQKLGINVTLAGKSVAELQTLLDEGKLDTQTAAIVQSLVQLQQQAIDTQNDLNEALTGTSYDSLLSSVSSLFDNLTTSADDFGKNFQSIIQTALLNSFKTQYLDSQLQGFYNDLTKLTEGDGGTLTKVDIQKLQTEYNTIIAGATAQFQNIQKTTGITFTDSSSTAASPNSLSGAISGITEDQANLLAGQFGGLRLAQLETNEIITQTMGIQLSEMKNQTLLQMQIVGNTGRTAVATESAIPFLKSIDSNTSASSLTGVLRAAGKN